MLSSVNIFLSLRVAHGLLEVLGGLALTFLSHDLIIRVSNAVTRAELLEDPRDIVANALRCAAEGFTTDAQSFAARYLISHGLIKLVLVAAVLENRVWAYLAFIAERISFILNRVYRMSFDGTFVLAATILDLVVLFLARHDCGFVRRERQHSLDAHR